ncbi:MAG: L-arabinose isomerase [Clostridiales Family XIII bacterium]|jgi:L-arabinose isomerase|nr:L-arabinose isomerase [Clostridiales Family XIII bacterium]
MIMDTSAYTFWLIVGSQFLYGPETLAQVKANSMTMAGGMNAAGDLPFEIEFKGVMKTAHEIEAVCKAANACDACAGVITFCHTFSPSKMWIGGLSLLQKPWLHFHTQFNREIPNEAIDMDYMNLHQSAHGDREHGFIGTRLRSPRKVVVGYWDDESTRRKISGWMRAAVGATVSRSLKVMRFGDNMREVAVTEGDKIEAQIRFGWQVNTWPVGQLAERIAAVTDAEEEAQLEAYREDYDVPDEPDLAAVRYQAREQVAIRAMLDDEGCFAFTNTFQDLHGMRQLPGLATQDLMSRGYGYGGEGDWKTAAMTAVVKAMSRGLGGGTSFMEDYTYDLAAGLSLGAHMLEVCPSVAAGRPMVRVHALGIGDREPPARLVFEGKPGSAVVCSLVDMGGRFRLIAQDIVCLAPTQTMPNLPVARVMWKPLPDLETGAEAWIIAGGAHHTTLSYDIDADILRDWARIMDIEFVHIGSDTDVVAFERDLMISDAVWNRR